MNPFIRKSSKPELGLCLGDTIGLKQTNGSVGIEIEIEGKNIPHEDVAPYWLYHEDSSLRGEENAEFVLKKPIEFDEVEKAVSDLWTAFKENDTVLDDSNRTSVHVHLNCQKFYMNRLASLIALWFAVEEPLVEFCGQHRVGNLFCLRGADASATITEIKRFVKSNGAYQLYDHLRYSAFNPNALFKYGSIEIRTLGGVANPDEITTWVKILQRLYELSAEFKDPREIPKLFSGGPYGFYEFILGEHAEVIQNKIGWSHDMIAQSMLKGVRLTQCICYCKNWNKYETLELAKDPFGRNSKQVLNSIQNLSAAPWTGQLQGVPSQPILEYAEQALEPEYDDTQEVQESPTSSWIEPDWDIIFD